MPEFSILGITDNAKISEDGHHIMLNLSAEGDSVVSLKIDSLVLQTVMQSCGFILTKARQLAAANPNFVPAIRPAKFRSDLISDSEMVGVVFALKSGLEHHYALTPDEADGLARQMQDAAERGRKRGPSKKPSQH